MFQTVPLMDEKTMALRGEVTCQAWASGMQASVQSFLLREFLGE